MDSLNLLPLLKQEAGASGHETLIHYASFGGCVIREGDWKLYLWGKPGKPGMKKVRPTKLFNLADNPGEDEERNLIEDPKQAERIEEMTERFQYSLKKPTVRP